MAKQPIDRSSPESLIKSQREKLYHINRTLEDLALAQIRNPDDESISAQLAAANRELAGIELAIKNTQAAINGQTRESALASVESNSKLIKDLSAVGLATSDEMTQLLPKIVAQLEDVHPLLTRYLTLGGQRQQAMHALQRAIGKKDTNRLARVDGHSSLIDALIGAVIRSGIGSGVACPNLAPHVVVSVPYRVPTLEDAQRGSASERDRVLEIISEARNPQPAATTNLED